MLQKEFEAKDCFNGCRLVEETFQATLVRTCPTMNSVLILWKAMNPCWPVVLLCITGFLGSWCTGSGAVKNFTRICHMCCWTKYQRADVESSWVASLLHCPWNMLCGKRAAQRFEVLRGPIRDGDWPAVRMVDSGNRVCQNYVCSTHVANACSVKHQHRCLKLAAFSQLTTSSFQNNSWRSRKQSDMQPQNSLSLSMLKQQLRIGARVHWHGHSQETHALRSRRKSLRNQYQYCLSVGAGSYIVETAKPQAQGEEMLWFHNEMLIKPRNNHWSDLHGAVHQ